MTATKKYNVSVGGLAEGIYHYEFKADGRFFTSFEGSEILGGEIVAKVEVDKTARNITLGFEIGGTVEVACDRCLEPCTFPVDYRGVLAVKFTDEPLQKGEEYDGEVLWLRRGEQEVDLAQYIYESVVLSLPYRRIHPEGADGKPTCDPDMLARFSIVSPEEFDKLTSREERAIEGDPQWEKLRELREKM